MVTVSVTRWLAIPLLGFTLAELAIGAWPETPERIPTSSGSNLCGDSPTMLLLKEAVSDNSAAECKDEIEEDVSSAMAERNGVLSDELDDGETPLDDPLIMTGLWTGIADVVSELPTSDDLVIP